MALAAARVRAVGRFAVLADDRGGVRDFCRRTLNIDPAAAGGDVNITTVVDAWEAAKVRHGVQHAQHNFKGGFKDGAHGAEDEVQGHLPEDGGPGHAGT